MVEAARSLLEPEFLALILPPMALIFAVLWAESRRDRRRRQAEQAYESRLEQEVEVLRDPNFTFADFYWLSKPDRPYDHETDGL